MPVGRYFIDAPLVAGATHFLDDEQSHHLLTVIRTRPGERIELVNGQDALAYATLLDSEKRCAYVLIESVETHSSPYTLILIQALARFNRLETIAEKGTELGMTHLWLFPAERSEKKTLSPTELNRLARLSLSSLKQCGRLSLPPILLKPPLLTWSSLPTPAYFGDLTQNTPPLSHVWQPSPTASFITGPESGLSPPEIAHLRSLHATPISLHPYTLRTDTASLAALTLLSDALRKSMF